jgi:endonuclease/exonuclease/phosphatase (EEP) superfamily protein YafD
VQAATAGGPAVLMGDFNLVERHPIYRQIAGAGLTDAFRAAGRGVGVTLPTRMARWAATGSRWGSIPLPPLFRVDYIWLTADLLPLVAWVGGHAGSDHLPVCVRLAHTGAHLDQTRPWAQPEERWRGGRIPAALARG